MLTAAVLAPLPALCCSLGEVLCTRRRSELELAKEAAEAAALPRVAARSGPHVVKQPGLEEVLVVRKTAMQRAKEEAVAANQPRQSARPRIAAAAEAAAGWGAGGLDSLKPRKSRLELEREAALAAAAPRQSARSPITASVAATQSGAGGGLGDGMVRHKSRLEREKEVAKAVELRADASRGGAPKSRLQLEKEAYERAMQAAKQAKVGGGAEAVGQGRVPAAGV